MIHKKLNIKILNHLAELAGYESFDEVVASESELADSLGQQVYDMPLREKYKLEKQINKLDNEESN